MFIRVCGIISYKQQDDGLRLSPYDQGKIMEQRFFRNIVITSFIKSLTLSITGMVDCAIVGHYLGADGLSAMKLAMPIFSILSLFSFVLSTGLSVTISKELSVNGEARANDIFKSVFTVICAAGICLTVLGIIYPSVLTDLFAGTACDPIVKAQTADYLRPILIGALPILLYDVLGTIALLGGASKYLKLSSAAILVMDVLGDYLAVKLNGGMLGIATASSAAYTIALIMILLYFLNKRALFKLGFRLPEGIVLKKVILLGVPAGITLICKILLPLSINRLVLSYGTIPGLAALSIQDSIRYVPEALCSGIAHATLILTSIFAAECDISALKKENTSIVRWSFFGGGAVAIALMLLSFPIIRIFTNDPEVHTLGVYSLLLYLPAVPFIAINSSVVSYYQALGKKRYSIVFTIMTHLIVPVFFAWILAGKYGDSGIYASCVVSEAFASIVMILVLLITKIRKKSFLSGILSGSDINDELRLTITNQEQAISASEQVNELCLKNGFSKKHAFLTALTVEELAINCITHGFIDNKAHRLELRTVITNDKLILRLRDDGRPFDLTERYKMINPDDLTRNIGLRIIFANADEVSYNSAMNMNNVCIIMNRDSFVKGGTENSAICR